MRAAVLLLLLAAAPADREEELREAAHQGDVERVRSLLDEGANVDGGNRYGATALFFAADKGNREVVALLIERGARTDRKDSFYGMTALVRALDRGHDDVVLLLLARDVQQASDVLVDAARSGKAQLVSAALATNQVTREAFDEALEGAKTSGGGAIVALLEAAGRPATAAIADVRLREDELDALAGSYRAESTSLSFEVREGRLVLVEGETTTMLRPTGSRSFVLEDGSGEVNFGGRGGMLEFVELKRGPESTLLRPLEEGEGGDVVRPTSKADPDIEAVVRGAPAPWPSFRGPNGSGIADGQGIAFEWDVPGEKNVRFATVIPGFSVSSPIIWGDRVFVLTAVSGAADRTFRTGLYGDVAPVDDTSEHRWLLFALDAADGRVVWERELHRGRPGTKRHPKSSQANSTPATDGTRVVSLLGSTGFLYAHDFDGNLLWKTEVGVLNAGWFYDSDYQWGHSSSPVLYDSTVVVQADVHGASFVAAYDLDTGREIWRTGREDEIPTFATPTFYRGPGGDELVTNGTRIRGYDPKTGALLWHLGPNSEIPVGSPVVTNDLIYVAAGYPPIRPIYAIRPGSRGDLGLPAGVEKSEALAWSKTKGGTYIPSPIIYRGYLYTNENNGLLVCYDAMSGELVYRERIGGVGGSFAASPIAADGRLYFTNEEGQTYVVAAGPEYRLVSTNDVDGVVLSTPAASDGLLVIRTLDRVYGIGEKNSTIRTLEVR